MKIAKWFSVVFAVLGTVLLVASVGLCLLSLNAPVRMTETPAGAEGCTETLRGAINAGGIASVGNVLYGQPDLGVERLPDTEEGMRIWEAFVQSLSCEFRGACYATDTGIARDAVITALDIPSVTEKLSTWTYALLTARVENATDMGELYDETNNFREDLVAQVLNQALEQALAEDAKILTREVTMNLICRDGQWWVVPDQALLSVLAGGVA